MACCDLVIADCFDADTGQPVKSIYNPATGTLAHWNLPLDGTEWAGTDLVCSQDSPVLAVLSRDECDPSLLMNADLNAMTGAQRGNVLLGGWCDNHSITCGSFTDYHNQIDGDPSSGNVVSGGGDNHIGGGVVNVITGGAHHQISTQGEGWHNVISGGSCNEVQSSQQPRTDYSGVFAGTQNTVDSAGNAVVIGGTRNVVDLDGDAAIISGGRDNLIAGAFRSDNAHIAGGVDNKIGQNAVSVDSSTVGGARLEVDGNRSAAIAGQDNTVDAARSVVIGGQNITGAVDDTVYVPRLNIAQIPTSAAGLLPGDVWNNGGVLNIV